MKRVINLLLLGLGFFLCLCTASAQTPAPSDPFEAGWHVTLSGGYSNLSGQQTNNGYLTSAAVRVAKRYELSAVQTKRRLVKRNGASVNLVRCALRSPTNLRAIGSPRYAGQPRATHIAPKRSIA